ncbi:GMP/IMP nucleotidase [Steroidobacter flavus]|uniref:GMP/IMP nucleotidase n=1 Tax=Steroidobacter flavus TaxID=1842136 RepID=A0ABV8SPH5_9GAMM
MISAARSGAPLPQWQAIDTVLLDMDGTLLDLRFDNYFWLELVPERYAAKHGLTLADAREVLRPMFADRQGTLDWYCIDFWTRALSLDIAGMKHEVREHVRFLPGAEEFLRALRDKGVRVALVTNAHRDSLKVKATQTGLLNYFDVVFSSHSFGVPKEHPSFWQQLQTALAFDPRRTLFVDDSHSVLRAAQKHGIAHIFAISKPDSALAKREVTEFSSVEAVSHLLDELAR